MKGKARFTAAEAMLIRQVLRRRVALSPDEQKRVRDQLRDTGFYISDWASGLTPEGSDRLARECRITVTHGPPPPSPPRRASAAQCRRLSTARTRRASTAADTVRVRPQR